jgi:putative DeoR family transcriptional regulator (stage III sporulation protein D)
VKDYIWKRVLDVANHVLETKDTVREAALVYRISKSTIHKDLVERLPRISKELAARVKGVLDHNRAERHLRGGEATRRKYLTDQDFTA